MTRREKILAAYPRMTREQFEKNIKGLKHGEVPENMALTALYAGDSLMELRLLLDALVDCVTRQERTLKMIRALNEALQKQNRDLKGGDTE